MSETPRPIKRKRLRAEKSAKQYLTLENLAGLSNGYVAATVNAALREAVRDTEDRGSDKKVRSVVIKVELAKVGETQIACAVKADVKKPAYVVEPTYGNIVFDGSEPKMEFSPHSGENPDQATLVDGGHPGTDDDDEEEDDNP